MTHAAPTHSRPPGECGNHDAALGRAAAPESVITCCSAAMALQRAEGTTSLPLRGRSRTRSRVATRTPSPAADPYHDQSIAGSAMRRTAAELMADAKGSPDSLLTMIFNRNRNRNPSSGGRPPQSHLLLYLLTDPAHEPKLNEQEPPSVRPFDGSQWTVCR